MKDLEKILLGVAGALGFYFVFSALSRDGVEPVGPSPRSATEDRVMAYADLIWTNCLLRVVEPALIASMIAVESGGIPNAQGAAGEFGLMQILPSTAEEACSLQPHELLEPAKNIACGTAYLRAMIDRFDGSAKPIYVAVGTAAYNAGPGGVRWDAMTAGLVVPASTKRYVAKVTGAVPRFRQLFQELPQYQTYTTWFPVADWSLSMTFFD